MKRVAIIGGGMSGLAAAHACAKRDDLQWRLYERASRLGGKIVTEHVDGFVIEGGPDSFITQKPWGLALCRELGLEAELIPCNPDAQKIYILVKGKLQSLPTGFRLTAPTKFWPFIKSPLFSLWGKCRMGFDLFLPPRRDDADESVASFITRRLGREASDKIGGPLMAGIYVADPNRLSLMSTFPIFREMERKYGSLIRAMRAATKRPAANRPLFMSFQGGMAQWVEQLSEPLKEHCVLNAPIERLWKEEKLFKLQQGDQVDTFDHIILACPLHEAATLLEDLAPESAAALRSIRYVSTATISLGYRLPLQGVTQPLDGYGFVVPASEQRDILACTWSSIKFSHRAPPDHFLLRAFVGGEHREDLPNLPDEELIELVKRELRDLMGLRQEPVVSRIYRWPNGNPQYDVGHKDRMLALMDQLRRIPGLHVAGSGYTGIGLPDCIRSGQAAVDELDNG